MNNFMENVDECAEGESYAKKISSECNFLNSWIDPDFTAPNHFADRVCIEREVLEDERIEELRSKTIFKRAHEVVQDPKMFDGITEPNSIFQNKIGSSYFLASIAALIGIGYDIKQCFSESSR
jgi:hypothetical protein